MKRIDVDERTVTAGVMFGLMRRERDYHVLTETGSAYLQEWCRAKLYDYASRCSF